MTEIAPAQTSVELRPLRVLLVEDDREVRETLAQLLMLDNHSVDCAADGMEALKLFQPGGYDVVCLGSWDAGYERLGG